jgi:hypothetical protein
MLQNKIKKMETKQDDPHSQLNLDQDFYIYIYDTNNANVENTYIFCK